VVAHQVARGKLSPRIPVSLFQRANEARRETGETHEAWFLRIAEAVADSIPGLYPMRTAGTSFPQRPARRRRPPGGEPLVQYPLRLSAEEQAPLHTWLRELPVASMSELVTTIVRLGVLDRPAGDG
jgi:hypothetical protein